MTLKLWEIEDLDFKIICQNNGYDICFALPKNKSGLDIGIQKGILFVKDDNDILFVADPSLDQFHMKLQCDDYIENRLKEQK